MAAIYQESEHPVLKWLESFKIGGLYPACEKEGWNDLLSNLHQCIFCARVSKFTTCEIGQI